MKKYSSIKIVVILFLLVTVNGGFAQFYNGHQMTFGKNRVQYIDFYWQYYRFNKLDTYFYYGGRELAQFTGKYASERIDEIENVFDYSLNKRIVFIIYNKLTDFRQSNVGLISGQDQYNIGGVTKIVNNKVFLYFEGEYEKLEQQISAAIAQVLVNEMLYGNDIKDKVTNSILLNFPEWYIQGLISYVSLNWSVELDNYVRDGILTGRFEKFNRLMGNDAVYAGHSIWKYIADTYGESVIPNILYLSRLSKNVESGFMYVLGIPLKDLADEWLSYYQMKYQNAEEREFPPENKRIKKPKKDVVYQQLKINPNGRYFAYVTNDMGKYKVWLYDMEKEKRKKIYKRGHRLEQITDYSYPLLTWNPTGELLNFVTEEKGHLYMNYYILGTKKLQRVEVFDLEKILSLDYSDDNRKIVFSAVEQGHTDIVIYDLASRTNEFITKDEADDLNPKFVDNSNKIIFSSNRVHDTITLNKYQYVETKSTYDLFVYNYKTKSPKLTRIVETPYVNEIEPLEVRNNSYLFLSDQNGIYNRWRANYDSTITSIDTSINYRYFTTTFPISNYKRSVLEHDFQNNIDLYSEILYFDGKYPMYRGFIDESENVSDEVTKTDFREILTAKLIEKDSLKNQEIEIEEPEIQVDSIIVRPVSREDTLPPGFIDINNYVFDYKGNFQEPERLQIIDSLNQLEAELEQDRGFELPRQLVYFTNFYTNYLVSQIDYSLLNNTYQPFTGGAVYFNPGFNVYNKIGATDLFEDYKITAGVRFSGNFDSNEYLISVEALKDRLDREFILHRQALMNYTESYVSKVLTHEIMYIFKFPLNQVASVRGTSILRVDRDVRMSTDYSNMREPNKYGTWAGVKLEYIFDNTKPRGLNFYNGTRFKVFGEYYKKLEEDLDANLFVVGADVRHYQKIHRDLIWANRFAASSSFGNSLLIYYLGGVDNLTLSLPLTFPKFDNTIDIDTSKNWVYQTVATNMRGFNQNIRNGSNFALINSEIRWPVIRYFANRPLKSAFLTNFAVVAFGDIGTAWSGINPYKDWQAYNYDITRNGPITVTVDKGKDPIVAGIGWGLRTKLLGYYIRADWSWGIENGAFLPDRLFYLSLNMDF